MASDKATQQGLTSEQVAERKAAGQVNTVSSSHSKTIGQIVFGNVFTYFNLINSLIFVLVLLTGRYANTLFMGVVISNLLIGVIQEIRAKVVTDRLKVLTDARATVVRDGENQSIPIEEIVLGDLLILMPGNQISADGVILTSQELEIDESLLTGESEPVVKKTGDKILSGSYVISGSASARVDQVGDASYVQTITSDVRKYKRAHSEIQVVLNKVIRLVSIIIVPVGALLFTNQFFRGRVAWEDAVVSSAAGMIGMIPEGLVLLTSVTLAVGVIRLARRRALVQELAGIEVLARVNVLCLDKTGTLTLGTLRVEKLVTLDNAGVKPDLEDPGQAIAAIVGAFDDRNATAVALTDHFGPAPDWVAVRRKPFASARKWSSATFTGRGTWYLGSAKYILEDTYPDIVSDVQDYASKGYRVVLLAWTPEESELEKPANAAIPHALILMSDTVRPEAKAALDYFAANDVEIKVISGDHPAAVSKIALELDLRHADRAIDASTIPDDPQAIAEAASKYSVFGQVTPQMKKALIQALKAQGNIVAMTGDGVNDVPALRESDCSIVMASGSDAAKGMSHILLLDSDFTVLPEVVGEGRQVIANIERVASLFLVKTTYATLLSVAFILIGLSYPFDPIHQTLLSGFAIGIPGFFLALEKNRKRVEPGFLKRVATTAIPGGLTISILVLLAELLQWILRISDGQMRLIVVITAGITSLLVLLRVCLPLNLKRIMLIIAMAGLFAGEAILFAGWLRFPKPEGQTILIIAGLSLLAWPLLMSMRKAGLSLTNILSDMFKHRK